MGSAGTSTAFSKGSPGTGRSAVFCFFQGASMNLSTCLDQRKKWRPFEALIRILESPWRPLMFGCRPLKVFGGP